MTDSIIERCVSFDYSVSRVQWAAALGKLRQKGFYSLEDFDSAEKAEILLQRNDSVAAAFNQLIELATKEGDARRQNRKRAEPASTGMPGLLHTHYIYPMSSNKNALYVGR